VVPIPTADCPLAWWAKNKATYPAVAAVVRHLLAIPATSVPSEWLFSKAGGAIDWRRPKPIVLFFSWTICRRRTC